MLFEESYRVATSSINQWHKTSLYYEYGPPIAVMEEDWDNLIILDACRYDMFSAHNDIDGELRPVVSRSSHSRGFLKSNFYGSTFLDTVHITANPYAARLKENSTFYKLILTYSGEYINKEFETYHPKQVTQTVLNNMDLFSDKRLIIHYMQPHVPYLGSTADELRRELNKKGYKFRYQSKSGHCDDNVMYKSLLKAAADGLVTKKDIVSCYLENLEIVLDEVKDVINELNGKTVITADHGELLGSTNRRVPPYKNGNPRTYGHPQNIHVPEVRVVPWLEIPSDKRRKIKSRSAIGDTDIDKEEIKEHLTDLGYID